MDNIINDIISDNSINFIKDNMALTNYELNILNSYNIDYKNCLNMNELIHVIESNITDDSIDELEDILITISDRRYYMEAKK